jgi:integrative and conjugative element protein (TIGR02256 family)
MKFRRRPSGGYLELSERAIETMLAAQQTSSMIPESGGMIVGRLIVGSDDVVVDEATIPTRDDQQGRFFFKRAKRAAQEIIDKLWNDSNCTVNYLGEWHTHPETIPHPSEVDLKNWKRITHRAQYEQDFLFFVIVGTEAIRVWEANKKTDELIELITEK